MLDVKDYEQGVKILCEESDGKSNEENLTNYSLTVHKEIKMLKLRR